MDDELLLSGANLSEDYFTDYQDRYISFVNGQYIFIFYLSICVIVLEGVLD